MSVIDLVRTSSRRVISRLGLLPVAFDAWRFVREWTPAMAVRSRRARAREAALDRPLPPANLMYSVAGSRSAEWFVRSGEMSARSLTDALNRIGRPLAEMKRVLDMGCGCGRVLRQWDHHPTTEFYGTDYNPAGVDWVRSSLPSVPADVNKLAPPLRYPGGYFDAIYAISVLTHIPEELQRLWMEEFHRILKPGGILLLTLSGKGFLSRLVGAEKERFDRGELVVIDADYAGTNMCSTYHPEAYIRSGWSKGFRILENSAHTPTVPYQDLWVFERLP